MNTQFYEALCLEEKKLVSKLDAVRLLKEDYSPNGTPKPTEQKQNNSSEVPANWPKVFKEGLTLIELTYLALWDIKEGETEDIANAMFKFDPARFDNNIEKALKAAKGQLTILLNTEKVIKARQKPNINRKKFIYSA